MLKNLKVRTKLIVVLAVPLVALIAMAAIGVLDRRTEAASARDDLRLVELSAARVELVHQLQLERTWTAAAVSGSKTTGVDKLAAQRTATDAAARAFGDRAAAARAAAPDLADELDRVEKDLAELPTIRASIDAGGVNPQVAVGYYNRAVLGTSDLASATVRTSRGSELQGDLSSLSALASLKEAQATINTVVTQITIDGQGREAQFDGLHNAQTQLEEQERRFLDTASDAARRDLQARDVAADAQQTQVFVRRVVSIGPNQPVGIDANDWITAANTRLESLRQVEDTIATTLESDAARIENDATNAARNFAIGAALATLVSLLLAALVARSIAKPLSRLTEGANRLSEERLPKLVEQLKNPSVDQLGEGFESISIDSRDEIGELARAFNSIQDVTLQVANEQSSLLRKGIGDIFVNLARRNQTLLDRQIEFIDQLETHEEDPDQLENLFRLDHLATRMRRNAESLLVLAGAEPPRRRGRPVDMADVVRVAIGEVEQFARVTLLALDEATVGANVAADLAHLLSELMENATQFSPPETQVEIVGHKTRDGNYVLSVSDHGIGMNAEQLAEANKLMANPPVVGLALSRSLGFTVIGRLAARFGIVVRLTSSPAGGVSALVTLPANLVNAEPYVPEHGDWQPAAGHPAPTGPTPRVALEAPPAPFRPEPVDVAHLPLANLPLAGALDEGAARTGRDLSDFDGERATAGAAADETSDVSGTGASTLPPPPPPPAPFEPTWRPAAPMQPAPSVPARTAATAPPLPTRKPRTADTAPDADSPVTAAGLTRRVPKSVGGASASPNLTGNAPVAATTRSPEEVRLMLSRYRSGLRRGRGEDAGNGHEDS